MIVAVGVDVIAIARVQALLVRTGERFLQRVFTAAERDYCVRRGRPAESLAARFAAKEAVMKCLATGFGGGIGFRDIEVVRELSGAVSVRLHAGAAAVAAARGIRHLHLSLSHSEHQAVAFVIAEA